MRMSFTIIPTIDNVQGRSQIISFDHVPGLEEIFSLKERQHEYDVLRLRNRIEELEHDLRQRPPRRRWRLRKRS